MENVIEINTDWSSVSPVQGYDCFSSHKASANQSNSERGLHTCYRISTSQGCNVDLIASDCQVLCSKGNLIDTKSSSFCGNEIEGFHIAWKIPNQNCGKGNANLPMVNIAECNKNCHGLTNLGGRRLRRTSLDAGPNLIHKSCQCNRCLICIEGRQSWVPLNCDVEAIVTKAA